MSIGIAGRSLGQLEDKVPRPAEVRPGKAGLVALERSPARLHEDHANARYLAEALAQLPGIKVDLRKVQTNIIIFDASGTGRTAAEISAALAKRNVLANPTGKYEIRMVTHCDVARADIERALRELRSVLTA